MRLFFPLPLRTLRAGHPHPLALLRLWVLGWFLLSQGVAILSQGQTALNPMLQLGPMQSFCTSMGVLMPGMSLESSLELPGTTEKTSVMGADCPWCSAVGAPPAAPERWRCLPPHPLAYALQLIVAAHIALMTTAALPARGPPVLSS